MVYSVDESGQIKIQFIIKEEIDTNERGTLSLLEEDSITDSEVKKNS